MAVSTLEHLWIRPAALPDRLRISSPNWVDRLGELRKSLDWQHRPVRMFQRWTQSNYSWPPGWLRTYAVRIGQTDEYILKEADDRDRDTDQRTQTYCEETGTDVRCRSSECDGGWFRPWDWCCQWSTVKLTDCGVGPNDQLEQKRRPYQTDFGDLNFLMNN